MPERSLRLKRDTPPEDVIAALNGALERLDAVEESVPIFLTASGEAIMGKKAATADEPVTPADVRRAVEHAVRETRTGLPDATAPWTLHLGPGCTVENTESGNVFTVEAGNAIELDANVKLSVLDKAEAMIDPRAKPKPRWTAGFHRTREVRDAVANLQRILGIAEDGLVGRHTVDAVKLLAELAKR